MIISASLVISIIALLVYSALLWVVAARNFNTRVSRFFSLYLIAMIVWSFGSLMIFASTNSEAALFWNRFMLLGSAFMPVAFFGFVQTFLMREKPRWLWFGIIVFIVIQVTNLLGLVIVSAQVADGRLTNEYGWMITPLSLNWVFFVGFSTFSLVQEYRQTKMFDEKNRIKYLLVTIIVIFTGSLTNATVLKYYPVDIGFNIISALMIAYAIFRYQLLDVNFVVRKSLLYSMFTVVIGATYFLVIFLITRIFNIVSETGLFILALGVAVLTAIAAQPLRVRAQNWIDKLFYREKYDANLMLQRLSLNMSTVLDLEKLTRMILDDVIATMHIANAGFFLRRGENGELHLMAQSGMKVKSLALNQQHPLVLYFKGERTVLTRFDFEVLPQFRALWKNEREDLVKLDADLFLPLRTKDGLVGIFAVGPKMSGLGYSQDDLLVLTALTSQMATSIENALLFTIEAGRRSQAETLQNVLSQLTSDLDLEQVLDNILINLETVIPYDSATVFLISKENMIAVSAHGFADVSQVIGHEYPFAHDTLFLEIQRTRSPVMISDVQSFVGFKGYAGTGDIKSWMGVPLIARGTVIGCLTLDSRTAGAYSQNDQADLAMAFASHASIAIENARLFRVEREQRQLAEALRDIGAVLSTTLDFDHVLDLLLDQVGRVVPYSVANIMLVENGRIRVARTRFHENLDPSVALMLKSSTFTISPTPNLFYLVDTALPLVIPSVPLNADWINSPVPVRSWVGAPVVDKGRVIACFSLASLTPEYYQKRHGELLSVFAGQAALALQNARLFAEIQLLAMTDDLTNTFNRRHLFDLGEREFSRAQRYNRPLSVVMLDIDDFKVVNDTHGHAVGDQILRMVAERCRANIREVDILGRYGGEEFTIVLPEAGVSEAFSIAERLRKHIAIMPMTTTAGPVKITISLGAAGLSADTPNLMKLIDCADIAMYEAKRSGRNAVCVYDEMKFDNQHER